MSVKLSVGVTVGVVLLRIAFSRSVKGFSHTLKSRKRERETERDVTDFVYLIQINKYQVYDGTSLFWPQGAQVCSGMLGTVALVSL